MLVLGTYLYIQNICRLSEMQVYLKLRKILCFFSSGDFVELATLPDI